MPTTLKMMGGIRSKNYQILATVFFLTTSIFSHADSGTATNKIPNSEAQKAAAQEMRVKEVPANEILTERQPGRIARSIFTSAIIDREPADDITEINNTADRIYFFTDLRNLTGQVITHRWEYNDKILAEVKFKVGGGPRWRVYSSKNLLPEWVGVWTVVVTDENENVLGTSVFNYTQATPETEAATAPDTTVEQKQ